MKTTIGIFMCFLLSQPGFSQCGYSIKKSKELADIVEKLTQSNDTALTFLIEFHSLGKTAAVEEISFLTQKGLVKRDSDLSTSILFSFPGDSTVFYIPIIISQPDEEFLYHLQMQKIKLCVTAQFFGAKKYYNNGRGLFFIIEDFTVKK